MMSIAIKKLVIAVSMGIKQAFFVKTLSGKIG